MNSKDIITASACDHNRLWTCQEPTQFGARCEGPCSLCTSLENDNDLTYEDIYNENAREDLS